MKNLILIICIALMSVANAQKTNYFQTPEPINQDKYILSFKDGISEYELIKFSLNIENKTNDILIYDRTKSSIISKNNKFSIPEKKFTLLDVPYIFPNKSNRQTIQINGANLQSPEFTFQFDGLEILPINGKTINMEEFKLPAAKNEIEAENFKVSLKKSTQKTQVTVAVFEVEYLGSDFGLIDGSKISVKVKSKDGQELEYANQNKDNDIRVLKKGDKTKITAEFQIEGRIVDMQFATMYIQWNKTFVESKSEKLQNHSVDFQIDDALTKEKN